MNEWIISLYCIVFSDAGVVTAAFWDQELLELPQSANLSVTCSVVGADRYDVIRVVHSYGAKTLLLTDNDVIGPIFASLPRYHVTYQYGDNTALVTVHIKGRLCAGQLVMCACLMHLINYLFNYLLTYYASTFIGRGGEGTLFSRSTDVISTDLVSAKGKTKEVYWCDIVIFIYFLFIEFNSGTIKTELDNTMWTVQPEQGRKD